MDPPPTSHYYQSMNYCHLTRLHAAVPDALAPVKGLAERYS